MENSISSTNLTAISFPVYKLGLKPNFDDGVVFYYYEKEVEDSHSVILRVIDDTTLAGDSLAKRRLALTNIGVPLFRIKIALFFLGDFIKIANPQTWFIDAAGKVFNYRKTTRAKLVSYKISQVWPIKTGGAVIAVEGISSRFKCLYPPSKEEKYVGILHNGMSRILYGFYKEKHTDTWRMI